MEERKEIILQKEKEILSNVESIENCKLISRGCKHLTLKNGWFKTISIFGEFETITFLTSRGEIKDSAFSCKNISIEKADNGCILFKNTIIKELETIECSGGTIEYENPREILMVSKRIYIELGGLTLDTSDLICPSIKFVKNSRYYFTDFMKHFDYSEICPDKTINILCDEFLIDNTCSGGTFGNNFFFVNSIRFNRIKESLFKSDFDRLEKEYRIINLLQFMNFKMVKNFSDLRIKKMAKVEAEINEIIRTKRVSNYY